MKEAIIFAKCLGLNDIQSLSTPVSHPLTNDPNAGDTELIDCRNATVTRDGAIENLPPLVTALTCSAPITNLSASKRFMFQDGTDTCEWDGVQAYQRMPICDGPIAHTPIDVRVCTQSTIYKSTNAAPYVMLPVTVGDNPNPITSKPFYQMPLYSIAFAYNSKLYAVDASKPNFLLYSEDYHYDLWALGDNFFGFKDDILQAGAVFSEKTGQTGSMTLVHPYGVTVLDGSHPKDFFTKYYDCAVIDGSLFSGFISKVYGYGHVFMCDDGVYFVDGDGNMSNLTIGKTSYLRSLNNTIYGAIVHNGKYFACGDLCTVESDFYTKTVMKHAPLGASVTIWHDQPWFANGATITTFGDNDLLVADSMVRFPYSKLGVDGAKAISDLYFTGTVDGTLIVTATDQKQRSWSTQISHVGAVSNYRIKTPRVVLGNHISFTLSATGPMRLERLYASLGASQRTI